MRVFALQAERLVNRGTPCRSLVPHGVATKVLWLEPDQCPLLCVTAAECHLGGNPSKRATSDANFQAAVLEPHGHQPADRALPRSQCPERSRRRGAGLLRGASRCLRSRDVRSAETVVHRHLRLHNTQRTMRLVSVLGGMQCSLHGSTLSVDGQAPCDADHSNSAGSAITARLTALYRAPTSPRRARCLSPDFAGWITP